MNKLTIAFGGAMFLLIFLLSTNPDKIKLPLLILPFMVVGLVVYQLASISILLKGGSNKKTMSKVIPMSLSFIAVSLLLLSSLHQLTWKDSFLVGVFTILFWLYVTRAEFIK